MPRCADAVLLGGKYAAAAWSMQPAPPWRRQRSARCTAAAVECPRLFAGCTTTWPAMDDDALRRGQPTVQRRLRSGGCDPGGRCVCSHGILLLADAPSAADSRIAMVRELAFASGAHGMCGGQALDLQATGAAQAIGLAELERLHALKTGALLRAAVRMGAIAAGAQPGHRAALDRFAEALGLAFQIRDDLLDVEGDSTTLGKTAGKDVAQAKATFPALIGAQASRARMRELAAAYGRRAGRLSDASCRCAARLGAGAPSTGPLTPGRSL